MAISPQKFREVTFQFLYNAEIGKSAEEDISDLIMKQLEVSRKNVALAAEKAKKIIDHKNTLDTLIQNNAASYELNRIPTVEKNLLRLGIFELLYDESIPPKVVIAEAIRLTRKYSSPESSTFINAVLDAIYKELKKNRPAES